MPDPLLEELLRLEDKYALLQTEHTQIRGHLTDYYHAVASLFSCLEQGKDPQECAATLRALQSRTLKTMPALKDSVHENTPSEGRMSNH